MPIWIPISILAALFQCWRTAKQQKLRSVLSVNGATFVRFLYGVPPALVLLVVGVAAGGGAFPVASWAMVGYAAAGGLCQILATALMIMAFGFRNFAVGTAYAKTETAQAAVIALLVLGETLHPLAWAGILVGLAGVLTLSLAGRGMRPRQLLAGVTQPAALSGLAAGFFFAMTAVLIKLALQSETGAGPFVRAMLVVFVATVLQTLMHGAWLAARDRAELRKSLLAWRSAGWIGVLSSAGSACWFTAFALTDVALVRAVGQIEVVFTLLFGRFYLKERLRPGDARGLVMVVLGVVLIVLGR